MSTTQTINLRANIKKEASIEIRRDLAPPSVKVINNVEASTKMRRDLWAMMNSRTKPTLTRPQLKAVEQVEEPVTEEQLEKDIPPGGAPKDHGTGSTERNKEKDIPPGGKPKEGWDSAERNRDKVIPPGGAPKEGFGERSADKPPVSGAPKEGYGDTDRYKDPMAAPKDTDVLSPDRRPVDLPPGTSKPEESIRDFNHPPDIRDKEDRPANLEDSVKGQAGADFFAGGDGTASDATGPKIGDSADKSPEERRKENAKRAADILSGKGDLGNDYQRGQIQEMYRQAMASEGPEGVAALTKAINDALAEKGSDVRIDTKTGTETGEFAYDSGNKSIYVPNQQAQIQTVNIEVQRGGTKTDQGKAEVVPSQYTKHPWSRVPVTPGGSGFHRLR